eukprot:TRINITY_DN12359_c0_g1_i1.p1 TRINITY_DN12359_c0_g1~~TRINITY_DN12359_c0_g1_i1.p1  ORF type:complete len:170 (+),score=62.97 TRINITY_DN12359_c0_g1_i1:41-511(+)
MNRDREAFFSVPGSVASSSPSPLVKPIRPHFKTPDGQYNLLSEKNFTPTNRAFISAKGSSSFPRPKLSFSPLVSKEQKQQQQQQAQSEEAKCLIFNTWDTINFQQLNFTNNSPTFPSSSSFLSSPSSNSSSTTSASSTSRFVVPPTCHQPHPRTLR